jgi:surface protein
MKWRRTLALVVTAGTLVPALDLFPTPAHAAPLPSNEMVLEIDLSKGSGAKVLGFTLDGYGQVTIDWDARDDLAAGAVTHCDTSYGSTGTTIDLWNETVACDYPDTANNTIMVAISGTMHLTEPFGFRARSGPNTGMAMVTRVLQWGSGPGSVWTAGSVSLRGAFQGATNLLDVPSTLPTGVSDISYMFAGATLFNDDISGWNTANVVNMEYMFEDATSFNQNIGLWSTSNVTNMRGTFKGSTAFNQNIGTWNTSNVTNMSQMFERASNFNQNIGTWNTNNVTDMSYMFKGATSFDQNISGWNTANVVNMEYMFEEATFFNQNIGLWSTSNVTNMRGTFKGSTAFNQNIGTWNTSNVTNMSQMFERASNFNQNIGTWNTSNITDMSYMFKGATSFDQNIGTWNLAATQRMNEMFNGVSVPSDTYGTIILGWSTQTFLTAIATNGGFDGGSSKYNCNVEEAWMDLDAALNITDGGPVTPCRPVGPIEWTLRIEGSDHYESAARLSALHFRSGVPVVFLVAGEDFSDALVTGPVADSSDGAILLVTATGIPTATANELERLRPERIVIVGGPTAISPNVAVEVKRFTNGTVERIGGRDRYETAALLSAWTFSPGVPVVYIATGHNFSDALAAGPAASGRGPLLMTSVDGLPVATANELKRLRPEHIVIVGGLAAISSTIEAEASQYSPGGVTRIAGNDRYETAALVSAARFPDRGVSRVIIANGRDFFHDLAAASLGIPVLLFRGDCVPLATSNEMTRLAALGTILLLGRSLVPPGDRHLPNCPT